MTVTPAPLPLPDLSRFGGGTWQPHTRTVYGTTFTAYRAVLNDPDYLFISEPDDCSVCNGDCYASAVLSCDLCDNHICHECGFAYRGNDLS